MLSFVIICNYTGDSHVATARLAVYLSFLLFLWFGSMCPNVKIYFYHHLDQIIQSLKYHNRVQVTKFKTRAGGSGNQYTVLYSSPAVGKS